MRPLLTLALVPACLLLGIASAEGHGYQHRPVAIAGAAPVYGAPVYASPVYSAPVYSAPTYSAPVYSAPIYSAPAYAAPVYSAPTYAAPAYSAPVYSAPAYSAAPYAAPGGCYGSAPAAAPYAAPSGGCYGGSAAPAAYGALGADPLGSIVTVANVLGQLLDRFERRGRLDGSGRGTDSSTSRTGDSDRLLSIERSVQNLETKLKDFDPKRLKAIEDALTAKNRVEDKLDLIMKQLKIEPPK